MNKVDTETLQLLARQAAASKDPTDYKKWSDAYDALVELTPEEIGQVAGGANSDHPNCYSGHAGGKTIDN